jgi:hypothetical protein
MIKKNLANEVVSHDQTGAAFEGFNKVNFFRI